MWYLINLPEYLCGSRSSFWRVPGPLLIEGVDLGPVRGLRPFHQSGSGSLHVGSPQDSSVFLSSGWTHGCLAGCVAFALTYHTQEGLMSAFGRSNGDTGHIG